MGTYRHKSTYICPYCNIGGWSRFGEFQAHVKKRHPGRPVPHTVSETFDMMKDRIENGILRKK